MKRIVCILGLLAGCLCIGRSIDLTHYEFSISGESIGITVPETYRAGYCHSSETGVVAIFAPGVSSNIDSVSGMIYVLGDLSGCGTMAPMYPFDVHDKDSIVVLADSLTGENRFYKYVSNRVIIFSAGFRDADYPALDSIFRSIETGIKADVEPASKVFRRFKHEVIALEIGEKIKIKPEYEE